jgi:endonuclease YncB( thermonuclease family)
MLEPLLQAGRLAVEYRLRFRLGSTAGDELMLRKRRQTIRVFLVPILVLLLIAACGGGEIDRLADLEAENEALREQLEQATSTTATSPNTTTATATSATTPTPISTLPPTSTSASTTVFSTTTTTSAAVGVPVLSITDGDTLRVLVDGENESLRLIGINAAENDECLAAEAAQRLGELMEGGRVRLESDVSDRDQFGRLLRYVYVGDVFVNEALVREGLAIARRYEPDTAQATVLEAAQAAAESDGVGMWAPDACGAATTGTIEIAHIRYDADGNDNFNLNDEWVEFSNPGSSALDLTGWSIKDESAGHRYYFPSGFSLGARSTVRLHTGCGDDTAAALYWCNQGSAVWNNGGDTVFVLDPNGNIVVSESYSG